jgi:cold shock CspA family protein
MRFHLHVLDTKRRSRACAQHKDGGADVFFHVSGLREGDEIAVGKAVTFEIGVDPKSGKTKAVSVDLV